jgi:hypothetical protein
MFEKRRRRKAESLARERFELHESGDRWEIRYWPHGKPCNEGCGYVVAWSKNVRPEKHWERLVEAEVHHILRGWGYRSYYIHSIEGHGYPWPVEMTAEEIAAAGEQIVDDAREYLRKHA